MESWMHITAITMLAVWFFNRSVDGIWPVPRVLREKNKEWWWRYIISGQIFSCVASIGSLYCFYEKPAMFEDLANSSSPASYNMVAIALGFFAAETIDVYFYAPRWWFLTCFYHHASIVAVYLLALVNQRYIAFSAIVLFVQIFSIFLFFHRLLRAIGGNESGMVYRINTLLELGTSIIRLFFTCWLPYFIFGHWKRIPMIHFMIGFGVAMYAAYSSVGLFRKAWKNATDAWLNHKGKTM